MSLKVNCPHCLSMLSVPRKLRGKVVICPCCREKCRVPLPATVPMPRTAAAVTAELAAEGHARAYNPANGSWIRAAVIASIAAAVVAVGGLILNAALHFSRFNRGPEVVVPSEGDPAEADPAVPAEAAAGGAGLAAQAEGVLRTHCYRCHGEDGVAEGGFNFVLRRDRLVANHQYVDPGKPDASFLLKRVTSDQMPPAGEARPSKSDIDILRRWIAAGAPDFAVPLNRPFVSNRELVAFIRQDLEKTLSRDRKHTRYFTLLNLFNSGFSDDEMETYRLALSKLINSLSWYNQIVQPAAIDPYKTIYRVDIRDLGWNETVWQAIIDANPYSVKLTEDTADGRFCLSQTECEIPHVRGDWFVAAASRPPLYHKVLQVPETLNELLAQRFPGVDLQKDIKQASVVRAGFGRSGVSTHNRLLEWHRSPHGYFWISYDFAEDTGRKNLFRHPLGPGKEEEQFAHDGGEVIFSLPNGMQGYMLVDATGKRIDKGPTNIVSDPKRPDRAVTNGVSCMSCHYGGIISKSDEIRKTVEANRSSFRDIVDQIQALYPPKNELDELFEENATRFRNAAHTVGLKDLTETGEPIVNMSLRFETDVDARSAASELGLKIEEFLSALKSNPRVQDRLGPLNVEGGTVKRDLFAKEFTFVLEELRLGEALKPPAKANKPAEPAVAKTETPNPPQPSPVETKLTEALKDKPGALRTWSDMKNNLAIEAEFVNLVGDKAELRKADGSAVQIPLAQLSPNDRKFIADALDKAPNTALPPAEAVAGNAPPKAAPQPPQPGPPVQPGPPPRELEYRMWHNVVIRKSISAAFVSLVKGDLKLKEERYKGAMTVWPMEHLSPEDQDFVKRAVGEDYYEIHKGLPPGIRGQY